MFLVNDGFHAGQYTIRPMDPMAQWEQAMTFLGLTGGRCLRRRGSWKPGWVCFGEP